ncbi:hypothetical protein [uncultured Aquimarina sp.]|uniref:hypothetical protein n=1 Tax=uncultured Aquimarina sp. TaxID=575652 RepID=UPI0026248A3C|nr:hypothetical protein [uncultured Aquimarina sp.]
MTGSHKIWLCNVFVGDAIYAYSKRSFTSVNRHYYDPRQIINEQSTLKKRANYREVEPGDIVVFGKSHVEIITSITKHVFSDDGFCSIGAGRGQRGSSGDGTIRCDSALSFSESRELENDNNTYFYL